MLAQNLASIKSRLTTAAAKGKRDARGIKLVCVTKNEPIDRIWEAIGLGITDIGENRVQEAAEKHKSIGGKAIWHLIGHLQTNKARDAVRIFSLIQSVDSAKLAREIDSQARKTGKVQDILVEVNRRGAEIRCRAGYGTGFCQRNRFIS